VHWDSSRIARACASFFIVGVLLTQAATLFVTAMHATFLRSKLFPFLEYPMYAPAHYEGERVTASWLLEGQLPQGDGVPVTKEQLGIDIFDFNRLVQATLEGDKQQAQVLRRMVRERVPQGELFTVLVIKSYPVRVTRDGPQPLPPETALIVPMLRAS
jgi:hypothetical protein